MSIWTLFASALGILGIAGALVALALYVCGCAVASVAADELKGWLPHTAAAVLATAVARLPEIERDRYHEEWLGELLAYQDRPVTALIFSVGVRRRVGDIVNELPSSSAPPDLPAEYSLSPWVRMEAMLADDDFLAPREFGRLLREARDTAKLNEARLSWELKSDYSRRQLAAWMKGRQTPTRDVVERWEQLCGLTYGSLVHEWERIPWSLR